MTSTCTGARRKSQLHPRAAPPLSIARSVAPRLTPCPAGCSFDNGSSVKRKLDNWQLLNKFFLKHQIPLGDKELIESMVHSKDKAALTFVCNMYMFLTQRQVPDMESLRITSDAETPYFARPTAARLIKESIKDSELTTTMKSQHSMSNKASDLLDQHSAQQRNDRTNDPSRFSTQQRARTERGPPKQPSDEEKSAPLIEFKEVSVKPIDFSVAQVRQSKDLSSRMMTEGSDAPGSESGPRPAQMAAAAAPGRSSTSVLEGVISRVMSSQPEFPQLEVKDTGLLAAFTDAVHNHDVSPEDVVAVCDGILGSNDDVAALGSGVLSAPKDLWTFFSLIAAILEGSDAPIVMDAVEQVLLAVGSEATAIDAAVSRGLFVEYALPLMLPMLSAGIRRRPALVGMYAFSENDVLTHARLIKTLQDSLGGGDDGVFVHCAAVLVTIESQFNDDLLDVYLYYAIMGSSMAEPAVRAAALSMLPAIIEQNETLVVNMLGRLEPMVEDGWWEVQAQLLQACAALLSRISAEDENATRVYAIADTIMTRYTSPNIQKIGLTCLAGCIEAHPEMCRSYVQFLLNLPHHFRMNLLGPAEEVEPVQILGATASNYEIDSLPARWNSYKVAQATVDIIFEGKLPNLEKEHIAVLHAAAASAADGVTEEETVAWGELFGSMKDFFYVSLCDEELCDGAVGIFDSFLSFLPAETVIKTFPTLLSSLLMIYPEGPSVCQQAVRTFLYGMRDRGGDFASEISNLATSFPPELMAVPELAALA